jgi:hypothetical protein
MCLWFYSNAPLHKVSPGKLACQPGHTIVDLGEDEFTVGRPPDDGQRSPHPAVASSAGPGGGRHPARRRSGLVAHPNPPASWPPRSPKRAPWRKRLVDISK